MTEINHRFVEVNGLRLHVAEAGTGPLVVLLHGFPECWYSWRHQLGALAEAGFHVVAPDQRGYTRSDRPGSVEDYTMLHLVGDVVGLIDALDEPDAVVVGHDWGAPVAWHTALLRPDVVRAVAGLSVPFVGSTPVPPLQAARHRYGDTFYQLYFQNAGVEKDFETDLDTTFRRILYGISGDNPEIRPLLVPEGEGFFDSWTDPAELPSWLTERDIATYAAEFAGSGFSGPLNWYRNIDHNWELTSAWRSATIGAPALFVAGDRDPVISWYDAAKLEPMMRTVIPDLRGVELLPGAGHWIQQERPAEVSTALVDFARSTS
ncbi:alpha/beta fold hydrolase [Pseudonocardia spinosispora]|uniref:alpha/beta fold hydrolase n=1 Tax=Pseudonocardia spinosispora TaxID=103441 RepID=UPI0004224C63|nr:alpha/beta hydrolase [Pseudonocardia spinosispora]